MSDVILMHNPRCSKSRAALAATEEAGIDTEVVDYLRTPLGTDALRDLLDKLEDEPQALVRRDPRFRELGLTDADIETSDQVAALLATYPELMERPVLVRGDRAIIGRPSERVAPFLAG